MGPLDGEPEPSRCTMTKETRVLHARQPSGDEIAVSVTFTTSLPYELEVLLPDGEAMRAAGSDLCEALLDARRQLETRSLLLCCCGARKDVWPSGMSGQMTGGRSAYVHTPGRRPGFDDMVDIFAAARCTEVTDVASQRSGLLDWHRRVKP
ncbi:hypothetical protein B7486_54405 [cyanobacterium TDX16]|nr:hypothetical protein B7486_54405 [cyanobacterium TDX16]